jgi:single-stranded-DNA-specific exonuclease
MIAMDGDNGKGSCRSIRGYHLYEGLQACTENLGAFGGHEMAAGLSLIKSQFQDFSEAFEVDARNKLGQEDLVPKIRHDGSVLLEEIDLDTVKEIEQMSPFGMGNPEPLMVIENVRAMTIKVVGESHLRFTACQGAYSHPAIAFGMLERRDEFIGDVDLLVTPQVNRYQGRESVQLRVKDVRPAQG